MARACYLRRERGENSNEASPPPPPPPPRAGEHGRAHRGHRGHHRACRGGTSLALRHLAWPWIVAPGSASPCLALQPSASPCIASPCTASQHRASPRLALRLFASRLVPSPCITVHHLALPCIVVHHPASRCIALHQFASPCIALHRPASPRLALHRPAPHLLALHRPAPQHHACNLGDVWGPAASSCPADAGGTFSHPCHLPQHCRVIPPLLCLPHSMPCPHHAVLGSPRAPFHAPHSGNHLTSNPSLRALPGDTRILRAPPNTPLLATIFNYRHNYWRQQRGGTEARVLLHKKKKKSFQLPGSARLCLLPPPAAPPSPSPANNPCIGAIPSGSCLLPPADVY